MKNMKIDEYLANSKKAAGKGGYLRGAFTIWAKKYRPEILNKSKTEKEWDSIFEEYLIFPNVKVNIEKPAPPEPPEDKDKNDKKNEGEK